MSTKSAIEIYKETKNQNKNSGTTEKYKSAIDIYKETKNQIINPSIQV